MKLINLAILATVLIFSACGTAATAPEKEVVLKEKAWTIELKFYDGVKDTITVNSVLKPELVETGSVVTDDGWGRKCYANNVILIKYLN